MNTKQRRVSHALTHTPKQKRYFPRPRNKKVRSLYEVAQTYKHGLLLIALALFAILMTNAGF